VQCGLGTAGSPRRCKPCLFLREILLTANRIVHSAAAGLQDATRLIVQHPRLRLSKVSSTHQPALTSVLRDSTSNIMTSFSTLPLITTPSSCAQAMSVTSSWWPLSVADSFQAAACAQPPVAAAAPSSPAASALDGLCWKPPGVLKVSVALLGAGRGVP
jgi:hypothetical protein